MVLCGKLGENVVLVCSQNMMIHLTGKLLRPHNDHLITVFVWSLMRMFCRPLPQSPQSNHYLNTLTDRISRTWINTDYRPWDWDEKLQYKRLTGLS